MPRCAVVPKLRKIFAILFKNNLVLRTNQQSLVKDTAFFTTCGCTYCYSSQSLRFSFNIGKVRIQIAICQLSSPAIEDPAKGRSKTANEIALAIMSKDYCKVQPKLLEQGKLLRQTLGQRCGKRRFWLVSSIDLMKDEFLQRVDIDSEAEIAVEETTEEQNQEIVINQKILNQLITKITCCNTTINIGLMKS